MKNISLGLQQSQKLVISPQLQHAIKLLQLSNLELVEKIETELAENPFLEEMEEAVDERKEMSDDRSSDDDNFGSASEKTALDRDIHKKDLNLDSSDETFFEDSSDLGYIKKSTLESDSNSKQQFLENAFAVETSLYEHLLSQLRLLDISDEEYNIGEIIVSSLDENGYFTLALEEVAESLSCTVMEVEQVLKLVQNLDPPGVGGRDLKEVLLIQMEQSEVPNSLAEKVVKENLS
ncbi:MAG: RNA polymerase sigma-54 factor, partial [Spirochaetota bacterium]|nr:RNA polymerase sigma-54 factor [Spirochaetota bacterium]